MLHPARNAGIRILRLDGFPSKSFGDALLPDRQLKTFVPMNGNMPGEPFVHCSSVTAAVIPCSVHLPSIPVLPRSVALDFRREGDNPF